MGWRYTEGKDTTQLKGPIMTEKTPDTNASAPDFSTPVPNQCDGCLQRAPLNGCGNHVDPQGKPFMSCTRRRYEGAPRPGTSAQPQDTVLRLLTDLALSHGLYTGSDMCLVSRARKLLPAVKQAAEGVTEIAGLGRLTDDDDGFVTLQFKDEAAAQAFMHQYAPSVEVDEMPPNRDTPLAPRPAELSDEALDELHERLERKVAAAIKADPANTGGLKVARRMYLRELLAQARAGLI